MKKEKYSLEIMLAVLLDDQAKGVLMGNTYFSELSKISGWLEKSIELLIVAGMLEEETTVKEAEDNVSEYYARRELEDRDSSRSASGYNSDGEIVELDFN